MSIAEKLLTIAENEQKVYDAGYQKGKSEGGDTDAAYEQGKAEGIEQGYEQGYNDGNSLYYAINARDLYKGVTFPENTELVLKFRKPPNIDAYATYYTFYQCNNLKSVKIITDDKETSWFLYNTFRDCRNFETVDLTECSRKFLDLRFAFYGTTTLKRILGELDVSECTDLTTAFVSSALEEVEFVPNSIKANVRFSSAYLTEASRESIINGLADLTGGTAQTLTLNGVGRNLTAEQKARIAAKNWTLAY